MGLCPGAIPGAALWASAVFWMYNVEKSGKRDENADK